MKDRIYWIDIARGMAILFVIFGHAFLNSDVKIVVYMFHMPLFFFISGFFLCNKDLSFKSFLLKKFKTVLFPYYFWGVILIVYWWLISIIQGINVSVLRSILDLLICNRNASLIHSILWFLCCLFVTEIIVFTLCKISAKRRWLIGGGITIIGLVYNHYFSVLMPFCIDTALIASGFMMVSIFIKDHYGLKSIFTSKFTLFLSIAIYLIILLANVFLLGNNCVSMSSNFYGPYLLFYLGSMAGIYICSFTSKVIGRNNILEFWGRNSLLAYALNYAVIFPVSIIINHLFHRFGMFNLIVQDAMTFIFSICIIALLIKMINKHFIWSTGKF